MQTQGIDQSWPVVTIKLTTFELKVIQDALEFARGEVDKWDAKEIDAVRDDIKRTLRGVDDGRSQKVPRFQILRRK